MLTCVESPLESFDPRKSVASSTREQIINLPGSSVLAMYLPQVVVAQTRWDDMEQEHTVPPSIGLVKRNTLRLLWWMP
jgi:hypothetical protein